MSAIRELDMRPMFVLGCPRSGTTLVGGFLEPSQWGNAVETHFITKYALEGKQVDLSKPDVFKGLASKIIRERPIMQWGIDWDLDALFRETEPKTYASMVDRICMKRSEKLGFPRWADKTPTFSFQVPLLKQLFPKAKYIFIYRDGRDVANSLLERNWGPNNIWSAASYWKDCCEALLKAEQMLDPKSFLSIRYEKLLSEPEVYLRELLSFLEYSAPEDQIDQMASKVRSNNMNKWKTTLSESSIRIFEQTAGDVLRKLGYPTGAPLDPLGAIPQAFYKAHDSLVWAKFMFEQNVIDGIRIKCFGKQPFNE